MNAAGNFIVLWKLFQTFDTEDADNLYTAILEGYELGEEDAVATYKGLILMAVDEEKEAPWKELIDVAFHLHQEIELLNDAKRVLTLARQLRYLADKAPPSGFGRTIAEKKIKKALECL